LWAVDEQVCHVTTNSDIDGEKDRKSNVEAAAADSTSTRHRMGGGVLLALLTLYDRNRSLLTFSSPLTTRSSLDGHDSLSETTDNTRRNAAMISLKSSGYTIVLSILRCYLQTQYPTRLLLPLRVASRHLAQSSPGTNYQGAGLLTIDLTILL